MLILNPSLVESMSDGLNAVKENTAGDGWFLVPMDVGAVLNRLVCGGSPGQRDHCILGQRR